MLGHEIDGIGRRHLSGDDEIALVLAVLGIDDDDHAAIAHVLNDLSRRGQESRAFFIGNCAKALGSRSGLHQARHVTREQVDLDVDLVARLFAPPGGLGQGQGDEIDPETGPCTSFTVSEVPSRATEPLGATKRASGAGSSNSRRRLSPSARMSRIRATPSTWPRDDMAAKLVTGSQRALEIDAPAGRPGAERRLRQGFIRDVHGESGAGAIGAHGHDGEAAAVAGNGRADVDVVGVEARADGEAAALAADDLADVGDDPVNTFDLVLGASALRASYRKTASHPGSSPRTCFSGSHSCLRASYRKTASHFSGSTYVRRNICISSLPVRRVAVKVNGSPDA